MVVSTIRAIVRDSVSGTPFSSGMSVLTSSRLVDAADHRIRFPVISESQPDVCAQVTVEKLLPVTQFLVRQPLSRFWLLAHRKRLHSGHARCFISMPWRVMTGWPPFRFESEGELLYYMKLYSLSSREFSVMKVTPLKE